MGVLGGCIEGSSRGLNRRSMRLNGTTRGLNGTTRRFHRSTSTSKSNGITRRSNASTRRSNGSTRRLNATPVRGHKQCHLIKAEPFRMVSARENLCCQKQDFLSSGQPTFLYVRTTFSLRSWQRFLHISAFRTGPKGNPPNKCHGFC